MVCSIFSVGNDILKFRENLIRSLKKAFQFTSEKSFNLQSGNNSFSRHSVNFLIRPKKNLSKVVVFAPTNVILTLLQHRGVIGKSFSPISCSQLVFQSEPDIIEWFSCVALGLLSFYGCVDNFYEIKKIVMWQLKYSLFATLGQKYKKNIVWAIRKFGKIQPKIIVDDKVVSTFFAGSWAHFWVKKFKVSSCEFRDVVSLIQLKKCKYSLAVSSLNKCAIKLCAFKADNVHYIKKLLKVCAKNIFYLGEWTTKFRCGSNCGIFVCRSVRIPLCSYCYAKIFKAGLNLSDLDDHFVFF